jgi:hypothetical protein
VLLDEWRTSPKTSPYLCQRFFEDAMIYSKSFFKEIGSHASDLKEKIRKFLLNLKRKVKRILRNPQPNLPKEIFSKK